MATSAALEDRVVNEIKRLCNAGLDQRTLLGEVVERLRRAIPFEAFCVSTTDSSGELVTYGAAEGLGGIRGMHLCLPPSTNKLRDSLTEGVDVLVSQLCHCHKMGG
jgi:hypothetical protein